MNRDEAEAQLRGAKGARPRALLDYLRSLHEAVDIDAGRLKIMADTLQKTQVAYYLSARLNNGLASLLHVGDFSNGDAPQAILDVLNEELKHLEEKKVPQQMIDELKQAFMSSLEINGVPLARFMQSEAV